MKLPFALNIAKKFFRKEGFSRKKMVAALVDGNRMFVSTNYFKSHPESKSFNNHIHAELGVLRYLAPGRHSKAVLAVYREDKQGNSRLAKPCDQCYDLIRSRGISKIYWSTSEGYVAQRIYV